VHKLTIALFTSTTLASAALAEPFRIGPGSGENLVVFESSAPMESFEGRTGQVSGTLDVDPAALSESLTLTVEVDMTSLDTGIGMRNTHMRENHLHTDRFPKAVFTAAQIVDGAGASLLDGRPHELRVRGSLNLHGVARTVDLPLRLTWNDGPGGRRLRVESSFDVALSDYEIPRPKFLVMKLNEIQKVRVDLWAVPGTNEPSQQGASS
jgi:polyisoprenoid-binding protein YceI